MSAILEVGKCVTWDFAKDTGKAVYERGVVEGMNDLTTENGIEKVTKFFQSMFPVIRRTTGQDLKLFKTVVDQTNRISYATMIFKSLAELPDNFKNKLQNIASTIILAIGALADMLYFVIKEAELISTSFFSNIADAMGKVPLFKLPVFEHLLTKPKDFFVFLGSFVLIIEEVVKTIGYVVKAQTGQKLETLKKNLAPKNLLKYISSFGKMILIGFGKYYGNTIPFEIVNVTTQTAGLLSIPVDKTQKKPQPV